MHIRNSLLVAVLAAFSTAVSAQYRATSEQVIGGWVNPESVGCDVKNKVLYPGAKPTAHHSTAQVVFTSASEPPRSGAACGGAGRDSR